MTFREENLTSLTRERCPSCKSDLMIDAGEEQGRYTPQIPPGVYCANLCGFERDPTETEVALAFGEFLEFEEEGGLDDERP